MDTAVSVLQSIEEMYNSISDAHLLYQATYVRMQDLLARFQAMEDIETLVTTTVLDKYVALARDFLAYMTKHRTRTLTANVIEQLTRRGGEVDVFKQELEALFLLFHVVMGVPRLEYKNDQPMPIDEIVRGMRVLLVGHTSGYPIGAFAVKYRRLPRDSKDIPGFVQKLNNPTCSPSDPRGALNERGSAANWLCALVEDAARCDAVAECGGIAELLKGLTTTHELLQSFRTTCARVLRRMSQSDVHEIAIVNAGAFPLLWPMIQETSDWERGGDLKVAAACAALSKLAIQHEHKLALLHIEGLVPRLIDMCRGDTSKEHKRHAAATLCELAHSDVCSAAIADAGGIGVLIKVLNYGRPQNVCLTVLEALWNLVLLQKNRTEMESLGGASTMASQFTIGAPTERQRLITTSTIAVLAQDAIVRGDLLGYRHTIEKLIKALQQATKAVRASAAWALAEMANHKASAREMVAEGALPALVAAFRDESDSYVYCDSDRKNDRNGDILRAKAGQALVRIAEHMKDYTRLVNAIAISDLVSLLRGTADQKQHTAALLACLALQDTYRDEIGRRHAISPLLNVAKSHWPKQNATLALSRLVDQHERNQAKFVVAGGVPVLMDVMNKTKDDPTNADTFENAQKTLALVNGGEK